MRYANGADLRRALEDRLRAQGRATGLPLTRLRKTVAFERFLARLVVDQPGQWLLKGGLALQWRLGNVARMTKDLDLEPDLPVRDVHQSLVRAALLDIGDWFRFFIENAGPTPAQEAGQPLRFRTQALLDGRVFEEFHIDVGWSPRGIASPDSLTIPSTLGFAEVAPVTVLCCSVSQHIAEKVHAYTRVHAGGESSRVKDLVDILLLAKATRIEAASLGLALQDTFAIGAHSWPSTLPDAPESWRAPFRRIAREVGLADLTVAGALDLARRFVAPVLQGRAAGRWDPAQWEWR